MEKGTGALRRQSEPQLLESRQHERHRAPSLPRAQLVFQSYAADTPATRPPVLPWKLFRYELERKRPATLVIPIFTVGVYAKLTRVQRRRHASDKALLWLYFPAAHVLIRPRSSPCQVPMATSQVHRRHMRSRHF